MTPKDRKIAKKVKERLSEVIQLLDFKVFGSRARGNANEFSDMDIFIEVENLDCKLKESIRDIIWEEGLENSIYISSLIFTRNEIENSPIKVSPILKNIVKEGIRV